MYKQAKKLLITSTVFVTVFSCTAKSNDFPFDKNQLSGDWAESYNNEPVCSTENLHFKMDLNPNEKKLNILLDRMWKLGNGETTNKYSATVISATDRTLIIRYDNETRTNKDGKLVEWELIIVGPGIYRWRETSWPADQVNPVVGIKCSN